ncbi:hypothetical protein [Mangrovimonas sp. ST2L15]|uniref:hypothetical protein n=1 Tax=Mangrovimonas sp. ST2L15 TaxID=1645916 RepID=UPI000B2FF140|nr:hypothetical protein [Mangrovimonas sp. ST2L15]
MKKLLLLFIMGFLCSCEIQYDISTRYVFEGHITDRNNQPIKNQTIELWIYNSHDTDLISYTTSSENGSFEMVIPKPTNEREFEVRVLGNSQYRQKAYVNIWESDIKNYYFPLDNVTLIENDDITQLQIALNQINPENTITKMELDGLLADLTVWVNPLETEYPEYYYDMYSKTVAKNQILDLHYEVTNSSGQTNGFDEQIIVGNEVETPYTITY